MKFSLLVMLATLILSSAAMGRPVSYPGGTTVMQNNDTDMSSIHIHYSPKVNYSIGYLGEHSRNGDWQFHGVQLNYLLKRWNRPASQANFYLKSGIGIGLSDQDKLDANEDVTGFTGIALDWEDRRYFASYENRYTEAGDIGHSFSQKGRFGVAPYIGDYGDLHTWLMVQVDHTPDKADNISITPLLRFFQNEYLVELGSNLDGDALFNLIIRF